MFHTEWMPSVLQLCAGDRLAKHSGEEIRIPEHRELLDWTIGNAKERTLQTVGKWTKEAARSSGACVCCAEV